MGRIPGITLAAGLLSGAALAATAPAAERTYVLTAAMTGAQETDARGDRDGRGTATIRIRGPRVCFTIELRRVGTTSSGHIHAAKRGKSGPVVVSLFSTSSSRTTRKGCVTVSRRVAESVRKAPTAHYVNVHTARFKDGAVRGQLKLRPRRK